MKNANTLSTSILVAITTIAGTLMLSLILIEVLFRMHHYYKYNSFIQDPRTYKPDKEIGWIPKENYNLTYSVPDTNSETEKIQYQTTKHGFILFGDINTRKKKILVIGDSFTQARHAGSTNAYYHKLQNAGYEVFAIGIGGYSPLQELLLLKRFFHVIKPHAIIWQFCKNDFFDNDYFLDKAIGFSGITLDRPYTGAKQKIFYRSDKNILFKLTPLIWHLRSLDYLLGRTLVTLYQEDTIESFYNNKGINKLFSTSAIDIEAVFKDLRTYVGKEVPILIFSSDDIKYIHNILRKVATKKTIYLPEIPILIKKAEKQKIKTTVRDNWHWNKKGHSIAGNELLNIINRYFSIQ